ncbi:MAG: hypothetical protein RMJ39_10370 [Deltaproteobacteria bacterium]|nr:hypothetical protein [Deltaproteobacteria bacterium]
MKINFKKNKLPFLVSTLFFFAVALIEYLSIIHLNNGFFVYTLDDPYIHLALAENILKGHYGVNTGEFSSPSSSILWPFIIAPFSFNEHAPLFINCMVSVGIISLMIKILCISVEFPNKGTFNVILTVLTVLFIIVTNVIGLCFTGMEHSLQMFVSLLTAYGLILENEMKKIKIWLPIAIVLAPLIRYECLAISLAGIVYLFMRNYKRIAILAFLSTLLLMFTFSIFLIMLDLPPLPLSVMTKFSLSSQGIIKGAFTNLSNTLSNRQGTLMSLFVIGLVCHVVYSSDRRKNN